MQLCFVINYYYSKDTYFLYLYPIQRYEQENGLLKMPEPFASKLFCIIFEKYSWLN